MLSTIWEVEPLRILVSLVLGFLLASTETFAGGFAALLCGVVAAGTLLNLYKNFERGKLMLISGALAVMVLISGLNAISMSEGGDPIVGSGGAIPFTGSRKCLASCCNQGKCTACKGTGWYQRQWNECRVCHGDGKCDTCGGDGRV